MMKLRIAPRKLWGSVTPPPSKSLLHRELIASALAGKPETVKQAAADVKCTVEGLRQLWQEEYPVIHCGDSGSTLRFLLPVAMARGQIGTVFTGSPRLMSRPIPGEWGLERGTDSVTITRQLTGGTYRLQGDETSQIVSGLLMALPLCAKDSEIRLTTPLVSRPYVDMTVGVLKRYGIMIEETPQGWYISGGQRYLPAPLQQEADWSAAAWFQVMNALGCHIEIHGLRRDSLQGDRQICRYCQSLPETVDVADIPDLLPPLALLAALQTGKVTHFTGAAFLRGKESDRLQSTAQVLNALGGRVEEQSDGLVITGVTSLSGGQADSWNDHRIAMLAGCAAPFCTAPVELTGGECVEKSYPDFWKDYGTLHGEIEVMEP